MWIYWNFLRSNFKSKSSLADASQRTRATLFLNIFVSYLIIYHISILKKDISIVLLLSKSATTKHIGTRDGAMEITFFTFLSHLETLVSFYTPWKQQNTRGFLMFSWGIEKDIVRTPSPLSLTKEEIEF